jgi:thiamine pyrophosphokinase
MRGGTAFVFAGAPLLPTPRLRQRLAAYSDPVVIAADSGAATALAFGFLPELVVGDLDSIAPDTLAELRERNVEIAIYPRDKEATDGQLAVEHALQASPTPEELVLLGFVGGPRLDQTAAALLALTALPPRAVLLDESNEVRLLRAGEHLRWYARAGELVSLIPLGADAVGVTTHAMRWPLDAATLQLGDTRGVSNEPLEADSEVGVELASGLLLVVRHLANSPL